MYLFSKLIWIVLSPLNLLLIFLVIGIFFMIINMRIVSITFYTISIVFFITVSVFPAGNLILFKLESSYPALTKPPLHIDGILILGGPSRPDLTRDHGQVSFNEAGERLTESVRLIKNYSSSNSFWNLTKRLFMYSRKWNGYRSYWDYR